MVDKRVLGQRMYMRTGSSDRKIAEAYLVQREVEIRRGAPLGERRRRLFREAALRYVEENANKRFVFASPRVKGAPLNRLNNSGWTGARARAAARYQVEIGVEPPPGFAHVRVHDLKHTLGRCLRAAGVGFETRQVLLRHTNGSVTTHYSAAEIRELIAAVDLVCFGRADAPTLTLIVSSAKSRKSHARKLQGAA